MSEQKHEPDKTPGIISWNELLTHDAAGSKSFYADLFGWTSEEMPMPNGTYTFFKNGERPVGGMINLPAEAEGAPPMWMSYITVSDIKASVEKAKSLGAKIHQDITELPMGSFAVITDPQGAAFALWQVPGEEHP